MKQAERFVTLALVLSLAAIPAIASAQSGGSGGSSTGGGIGAGPTASPEGGRGWDQVFGNGMRAAVEVGLSAGDGIMPFAHLTVQVPLTKR